mgnify:FL=1
MSRKKQRLMKKFFSIGETAKIVGLTSETLRHYDRIGLVKPCKADEWTGYRYYSRQEIVKLDTIKKLRCMDLSLDEIKTLLSYDDFGKIVDALRRIEKNADDKIAELQKAKERIARARTYYESKLREEPPANGPFVKRLPERIILLSDSVQTPTLDNLWNYHRHFFKQLPEDLREKFSFEDLAGIYESEGRQRLFAVCTRYEPTDGIVRLPQGNYLCADCTEETRRQTTERLTETAQTEYKVTPGFALQLVVVSGILQWNYQAQVFISE